MNPAELFQSLPKSLASGLAANVLDGDVASVGTPELRALARYVLFSDPLDPRDSQWLAGSLDAWLQEYAGWCEQADDVYQTLIEIEPVDVAAGVFPGWYTAKWVRSLIVPWAQDLPVAVAEARAYLTR